MMRAALSICLAFAVGLGGCVIVDADDDDFNDRFDDGRLELLRAASVDADAVRVRVASNGCTSEDSFDVRVRGDGRDGAFRVVFLRENPDRCRALVPGGVALVFPRERLGLAPDAVIRIANPVGG